METYVKMRGTYRYAETIGVYPTITYRWHNLRVEIISSTKKMHEVKLLGYHATNKKQPGDIMRVRRVSVKLDAVDKHPAPNVTPTDGAEKEIRLPYKDND